jgi:hypothetical protein
MTNSARRVVQVGADVSAVSILPGARFDQRRCNSAKVCKTRNVGRLLPIAQLFIAAWAGAHRLRDPAATMVRRGVPLEVVAQLLRHRAVP